MFSIANAIVSGQGFASPYFEETGPTAQQTPAFPYFIAALYYIGGGSMDFAVRALLRTQRRLFWTYLRSADRDRESIAARLRQLVRLGLGSFADPGILRSCFPLEHSNLHFYVRTLDLALDEDCGYWGTHQLFLVGILAGASLLLNPAHILVIGLILSTLWIMGRVSLRQFAIATCAMTLIVGPWMIRNNIELGYPTFIRSNFGFEIYHGLLYGPWEMEKVMKLIPGRNPTELALYKELGEHRYMAEHYRLVKDLVVNDPSLVLHNVASQFIAFWTGNEEVEWRIGYAVGPLLKHILFAIPALTALWGLLLLRQSKDRVAKAIIIIIVLTFPFPYYLAVTGPRYRVPIEPFLVLLTVYGFLEIRRDMHQNRRRSESPPLPCRSRDRVVSIAPAAWRGLQACDKLRRQLNVPTPAAVTRAPPSNHSMLDSASPEPRVWPTNSPHAPMKANTIRKGKARTNCGRSLFFDRRFRTTLTRRSGATANVRLHIIQRAAG